MLDKARVENILIENCKMYLERYNNNALIEEIKGYLEGRISAFVLMLQSKELEHLENTNTLLLIKILATNGEKALELIYKLDEIDNDLYDLEMNGRDDLSEEEFLEVKESMQEVYFAKKEELENLI